MLKSVATPQMLSIVDSSIISDARPEKVRTSHQLRSNFDRVSRELERQAWSSEIDSITYMENQMVTASTE
jgi:hypothetical protein